MSYSCNRPLKRLICFVALDRLAPTYLSTSALIDFSRASHLNLFERPEIPSTHSIYCPRPKPRTRNLIRRVPPVELPGPKSRSVDTSRRSGIADRKRYDSNRLLRSVWYHG